MRLSFSGSHLQVEHFDKKRECHREICVASRNMKTETFADEVDAYQQEKAKREHLDRWMTFDETAHRLGEDHHNDHCHDHSDDHHRNLIDHPDSGDHRIERKHDVEKTNLHEHSKK